LEKKEKEEERKGRRRRRKRKKEEGAFLLAIATSYRITPVNRIIHYFLFLLPIFKKKFTVAVLMYLNIYQNIET
jgi:hypothetical protein